MFLARSPDLQAKKNSNVLQWPVYEEYYLLADKKIQNILENFSKSGFMSSRVLWCDIFGTIESLTDSLSPDSIHWNAKGLETMGSFVSKLVHCETREENRVKAQNVKSALFTDL